MKIADLYIRVSTDEQADKGYSQRAQEEHLRSYCINKDYQVREVILEDHSAKTFNRPAWKAYLSSLKKNRFNYEGLVLFTKWDRFSRNTSDAYQMISQLRSYGVEPQAIEQPLDLSIPENKMMLAFYLAAPEVENDRRALNVFHGMRRARKEGRYVSNPPIGYGNFNTNGRKYIAPKYPQADLMKWVFAEIGKGEYTTEQVWRKAKGMGLKTGLNNFYMVLRNPVYCGKILVPAFNDEPAYWAEGQHEGIVTESVFRAVSDILNKRKGKRRQIYVPDQLPLRGYIYCGRCNVIMTGSASKGRTAYYCYYHGFKGCRCRYKAVLVNTAFKTLLKEFIPQRQFIPLFKRIIKKRLIVKQGLNIRRRNSLVQEIEASKTKIGKARELLLSAHLEPEEYLKLKEENLHHLSTLESELARMPDAELQFSEMNKRYSADFLRLDVTYAKATTEHKRRLITMLFQGKLSFVDNYVIYERESSLLKLTHFT